MTTPDTPVSATRDSAATVPVGVLLERADVLRSGWLANDSTRFAALAIEGIAHDTLCEAGECEDSTVDHLRKWVADHA